MTMPRASSQSKGLRGAECVAIVGGGPAGSFFAIHLLRESRRLGLGLGVVIVEKRGLAEWGAESFQCRGCSFCAGGISPRLHQILEKYDLGVPEEIVQGRFDY